MSDRELEDEMSDDDLRSALLSTSQAYDWMVRDSRIIIDDVWDVFDKGWGHIHSLWWEMHMNRQVVLSWEVV